MLVIFMAMGSATLEPAKGMPGMPGMSTAASASLIMEMGTVSRSLGEGPAWFEPQCSSGDGMAHGRQYPAQATT